MEYLPYLGKKPHLLIVSGEVSQSSDSRLTRLPFKSIGPQYFDASTEDAEIAHLTQVLYKGPLGYCMHETRCHLTRIERTVLTSLCQKALAGVGIAYDTPHWCRDASLTDGNKIIEEIV